MNRFILIWLTTASIFQEAAVFAQNSRSLETVIQAGSGAHAAVADGAARWKKQYSPSLRFPRLTNLYWGDTHVHSSYSVDAYGLGTTISPDDAYRFGRGEEVVSDNGMSVKLRRPLDFMAVADHSEYLGLLVKLDKGEIDVSDWEFGREVQTSMRTEKRDSWLGKVFGTFGTPDLRYRMPELIVHSIWSDVTKTADRYNEPGEFTTFSAYEWSSEGSGSDNLHRVVLFKDNADIVSLHSPLSTIESWNNKDPETLWKLLAQYESETGGEVIAIPHNGNASNGRMFAQHTMSGKLISASYAMTRARWEPIYEVTQMKGDGETHPLVSPADEFADFERWDYLEARGGNELAGDQITRKGVLDTSKYKYNYARSGLLVGLQQEARIGANPFKFGLLGSTDSHTGLSTTREDNFFGKFFQSQPRADRATSNFLDTTDENWHMSASGLAAVWAVENTREAIFAAFKRREVYATTGTRIRVRFFGGWDFMPNDVFRPDFASIGYAIGIPMGGELVRSPTKQLIPKFMVAALRDPDGANLDRVQIIKGWLDAEGQTHEKVYDVALSNGRQVNQATGKTPTVGSTVNISDASYTNEIGAVELATVWTDPDFNPEQRAFYYVRVLEIPTPRWTAYDAKFFGLKDIPDEVPMITQERAYTSPIWYTPAESSQHDE